MQQGMKIGLWVIACLWAGGTLALAQNFLELYERHVTVMEDVAYFRIDPQKAIDYTAAITKGVETERSQK